MSYCVQTAFAALLVGSCVIPARAAYTPVYGGVTFPDGTGITGSGTTGSGETESVPSSSPTPGGETVGSGVGTGTATDVANNAVVYTQAQRFATTGATLLNGLGGYSNGNATDAAGDIVGYSYLSAGSGTRQATYWAAGSTTATALNPLNLGMTITSTTAASDQAYYINTSANSGNLAIYGYATLYNATGTASLGTRAVRWNSAGVATQFGDIGTSSATVGTTPAGTTNARAFAANTSGTSVGYATSYSGSSSLGFRAVRWDANGVASRLGDDINNTTVSTTQNVTATAALSINSRGDAVGFGPTYDSSGNSLGNRALAWLAGTTVPVQLGVPQTYATFVAGQANDYAFKVNATGEAVGTTTTTSASFTLATRWDTSTGNYTLLGSNPSYTTYTSAAYDVNDSGIVAGDIRDSSFVYHATVWGSNDVPIDLNTLIDPSSGWDLLHAYSITDDGWVSAVAQYTTASSSYTRDFLLQLPATLVPEPGTLMLAGIGSLAFLRRRRSAP